MTLFPKHIRNYRIHETWLQKIVCRENIVRYIVWCPCKKTKPRNMDEDQRNPLIGSWPYSLTRTSHSFKNLRMAITPHPMYHTELCRPPHQNHMSWRHRTCSFLKPGRLSTLILTVKTDRCWYPLISQRSVERSFPEGTWTENKIKQHVRWEFVCK